MVRIFDEEIHFNLYHHQLGPVCLQILPTHRWILGDDYQVVELIGEGLKVLGTKGHNNTLSRTRCQFAMCPKHDNLDAV